MPLLYRIRNCYSEELYTHTHVFKQGAQKRLFSLNSSGHELPDNNTTIIAANLLNGNYVSVMFLSMFIWYLLKSSEQPYQLPALPTPHFTDESDLFQVTQLGKGAHEGLQSGYVAPGSVP